MNVEEIRNEMLSEANNAAMQYLNKHLNGQDQFACGFSWITVYPEHKGNTRAGRAERKILEELGFRKDWTGKTYEFWNPSRWPGQNVDVKEAGSQAGAEVLRKYGFRASAASRLD